MSIRAKHDPRDPNASALYGDLTGLPPLMIHVGEDEILLDDARRYAERAEAAGSGTELHIWRGMVHVFPANIALLHAAREALDSVGEFLRRNLVAGQTSPRMICSKESTE